jgi:hypothetical protein
MQLMKEQISNLRIIDMINEGCCTKEGHSWISGALANYSWDQIQAWPKLLKSYRLTVTDQTNNAHWITWAEIRAGVRAMVKDRGNGRLCHDTVMALKGNRNGPVHVDRYFCQDLVSYILVGRCITEASEIPVYGWDR